MGENGRGQVCIAGNTALDILVRGVEEVQGAARDGWGANVQILDQSIEMVLGGNGAAPAYVLGRLGQPVRLISNIGSDSWSDLLHNWLVRVGVSICPGTARATAAHIITLNAESKRRSYYYAGEKVSWQDALEGDPPQWFFAAGYGLVDADDLAQLTSVFATMRQRGVKTAFDPSPWFADRVESRAMLDLWGQVDCLVATQEELSVWQEADSPQALAEQIVELGPEVVVIKRGGEGAIYAGRAIESGCVSAERLEATNTVGAGDSFNGRLLYGLCNGEKLPTAVSAAVSLATQVVRRGKGVLGALD